jgi:D-glycero-D-manno-heptose 1,7-bisphosphate phosphatase
MALALMQSLGVEPEETILVGDSLRDLQAGRSAGCRAVLVRTGNGTATEADARKAGFKEVYDDLAAFSSAEIARLNAISGAQQ